MGLRFVKASVKSGILTKVFSLMVENRILSWKKHIGRIAFRRCDAILSDMTIY